MTGLLSVRQWSFVHRWSSLVCTLFLLMLCLTGLPLIFHDEIEAWTEPDPFVQGDTQAVQGDAQVRGSPDMDGLVQLVRDRYPDRRVQFVVWLEDEGTYRFGLTRSPRHPPDEKPFVLVDGRNATIVGEAWSEKDWRHGGFMECILRLHTDMFAGLAGSLILAGMGALLVVSLISGLVLYGPFMSKLRFGTVRRNRARSTKWLDLHNLLGVVTVAWVCVVGVTGIINTLDTFVFRAWQSGIEARLHLDRDRALVETPASLQRVVDAARGTAPGMAVSFVAFPGSMFAGRHHYAVYLRGDSPLTSRLLRPVLVDAASAAAEDAGEPPWYLWLLEGARPLHFGDYGGLPLKILWALFDLVSIVVLASGVYLWLRRYVARGG